MATRQAQKRLTKEYKSMVENPPPFIIAQPNENNILEWHYVISGPPETPYSGGQYHGTLVFPSDYPFKPPAIRMVTPSGRFREDTRLCLSMSDYHPDTWNPSWSVSTILTGLLSFMTSSESTTGAIVTTPEHKKKMARASKEYNTFKNVRFKAVFPDLVKENLAHFEELRKNGEPEAGEPDKDVLEEAAKEQAIKISDITDPEDRIRVEEELQKMQKMQAKKGKHDNNRSKLYIIFAIVLVVAGIIMK
ncbi:LANO_0F11364g1_1 [Lachancea nothofagi CBS 11611]|uniref:Ubiquitin-conjugating enzyme E2 6 n=1 Tax=Lachancea nothofagi CBS 11611 TaxID=1266666 RepID=A0A1G4KAT3_9SACH|nr:LANO_0F11364g1_1 [Lachancea nothofagi CBS 11611]